MMEKLNPYKQAIDILHSLVESKINPDAPGGEKAQEDQLIGLANEVFQALAHEHQDSTFNGFTNLLRKARQK